MAGFRLAEFFVEVVRCTLRRKNHVPEQKLTKKDARTANHFISVANPEVLHIVSNAKSFPVRDSNDSQKAG